MFTRIGPLEITILLVIILILFGPGRIAKVAKELGQGISNFRDGLNSAKKDEEKQEPPKTEE